MKDIKTKITRALDLPPEVLLDAPIITMQSNQSFSCDNHAGLLEYSDTVIRFMTPDCAIGIAGKNLSIVCFDRQRIKITGHIVSICFE